MTDRQHSWGVAVCVIWFPSVCISHLTSYILLLFFVCFLSASLCLTVIVVRRRKVLSKSRKQQKNWNGICRRASKIGKKKPNSLRWGKKKLWQKMKAVLQWGVCFSAGQDEVSFLPLPSVCWFSTRVPIPNLWANIQSRVIIHMNVISCGFASLHSQEWIQKCCVGSAGLAFFPSLKLVVLHHGFL